MFDLEVSWEDDTYIVRQNNEFILDTDDLHNALQFALDVGSRSNQDVIVRSVKP